MGKIGRYQYPEIGPEQATSIIRTIKTNFGDTIDKEDREGLAQMLGHEDSDSGAFKQKLTALKRYGLLEGRGTLATTELARHVMNDGAEVYREMLANVQLLNHAFNRFNGEPVETPEWESFLEEQTGIGEGVDDIPEANRLRNIYLEFVRLIPEDTGDESPSDYLDTEREFDYYVKKLDNPHTREPAIDALQKNLRRKSLPDAEPLDKVLEFIREGKYPDQQPEFFKILRTICIQNDLERLDAGKRDEVIKLLYEKMEEYSSPENITDRSDSLKYVLDTLEQLHPDDLVEEWWSLLLRRLKQGNETENSDVRKFAYQNLADRLMKKNRGSGEVVDEFFEERSADAEETLWELMADTENDELRDDCQYLLGKMDVL